MAPTISETERERRDLLARYHLEHHELPPAGQRDVATLRSLLAPTLSMSRADAMREIERDPVKRSAFERGQQRTQEALRQHGAPARASTSAEPSGTTPYAQLSYTERARLAQSDHERYRQLRAEHHARIEQLEEQLADAPDREAYKRIRAELQMELGQQ